MAPPPVPVTVTGYVPGAVDAPTLSIRVEDPDPGAVIEGWLNAAVAPVGNPDAVREIAELKPRVTDVVTALVPCAPWATDTEPGEAVTVNGGAVTVSAMPAVCEIPPPFPVTVIV